MDITLRGYILSSELRQMVTGHYSNSLLWRFSIVVIWPPYDLLVLLERTLINKKCKSDTWVEKQEALLQY